MDGLPIDVAMIGLGAGTLTQVGGTSTLNGTSGAGTVNVNAGTLALGASDRLADTTAVTVNANGTLDIAGYTDTVGNLTLNGTLAGTGTLTAATYALNGATVNANLGAGTLNQVGGTSLLNGTSGAGTVNVNAGALVLGSAERLVDTAAVAIANGAQLTLGGTETIGTLSGAGIVALGTSTLVLSNAADTFSGSIAGSGGLTLAAGNETLLGTNTYTGTTTIGTGATLTGTSASFSPNSAVALDSFTATSIGGGAGSGQHADLHGHEHAGGRVPGERCEHDRVCRCGQRSGDRGRAAGCVAAGQHRQHRRYHDRDRGEPGGRHDDHRQRGDRHDRGRQLCGAGFGRGGADARQLRHARRRGIGAVDGHEHGQPARRLDHRCGFFF